MRVVAKSSALARPGLMQQRIVRPSRTTLRDMLTAARRGPAASGAHRAGRRAATSEGQRCDDELLSLTTPLLRRHLNPFGRLAVTTSI
jgi:hypothetical protein